MADVRGIARPTTGGVTRGTGGSLVGLSATRDGAMYEADWLAHALAVEGRVVFANAGAAQNTAITGVATSFAATTPDFTVEVPAGTTMIPLSVSLVQTGTVAGGLISVLIGYQGAAERSSAGTAAVMISSSRSDKPYTPLCTLYTAPTVATDTLGVRLFATSVKPDVTNTLATNHVYWSVLGYEVGIPYLVGPAALKVYTWAATTAPTWFADFSWAELPSASVTV